MPYGYNNDYRRAGGYRPSSRNKIKRRNIKRIRNRTIIILSGLIVCTIAVAMIVGMFRCVSGVMSCNSTTQVPTATTAPAAKTTKSAKKTTVKKDTLKFTTPKIKENDAEAGVYDELSGLYVWDKKAFEPFYGSEAKAKEYAEIMNSAKERLGNGVNVYSIIVPNHTEMGLPSKYKSADGGVQSNSQSDYIKTAYKAMDESVNYVNIYNTLAEHNDEYIYFNSDHHWTGLGGYYAYEAFAKFAKLTPISLSDMQENKIEGFTGSFTELTAYPLDTDTVHFWSMPFDVKNSVTQADGNVLDTETMYYWSEGAGTNTYGVFLFGDNPLEVIQSKSETAKDEKIAIVHESYGNAMIPYFAANYSEIHSIDFRSFTGDLKTYCKDNAIKNVLFVNGVMSSATETQLESIRGLIGG